MAQINHDFRPRHKTTCVGRQQQQWTIQFIQFPQPFRWDIRQVLLTHARLKKIIVHFCFEIPWAQTIGTNVVFGPFDGMYFAEHLHGSFRRRIIGLPWPRPQGQDGSYIHNASWLFVVDQSFGKFCRHEEISFCIDGQHMIKLWFGHVHRQRWCGNTRAVHQYIQWRSIQWCFRTHKALLDGCQFGDVDGDGKDVGVWWFLSYFCRHTFKFLCSSGRQNDIVATGLG